MYVFFSFFFFLFFFLFVCHTIKDISMGLSLHVLAFFKNCMACIPRTGKHFRIIEHNSCEFSRVSSCSSLISLHLEEEKRMNCLLEELRVARRGFFTMGGEETGLAHFVQSVGARPRASADFVSGSVLDDSANELSITCLWKRVYKPTAFLD